MFKRSIVAIVGVVPLLAFGVQAYATGTNGAAGQMPAFFNGQLITINLKEEPSIAESNLLASNKSVNIIYMSDQATAAGFSFTSVINEIQGVGFNPLWQEVQIVFPGPPFQLASEAAIKAAAAAGLVTLTPTTQVYRCSVVGTP